MADISAHRTHAVGRQKMLGHLAMLLFALLVAGSFSLGGLAAPHIGPSALNALRFLLGTAVIGTIALVMTGGRIPKPVAPWRYLILGALMAVFFVTMFVGLLYSDPVSTGAVFTLMPLFGALFGFLILGQVPGKVVLASLVFAGLGAVWVIFRGDVEALLAFDLGYGEAIFLVGVACHALYSPLVRRFNRGEVLIGFTFWTMLATGFWIVLYGAVEIFETDWLALPMVVWVAILYLVIFTTSITFFLMQFASMRLPSSKVLAYTYLTPSFVILIEGALGHGWAPASVLAGALVTVMGLVVLAISRD
ncbi:MAG: DMT family transporter [Rhizobiaceae bacterium]